jgi:hypothetical protein
LIRNDVRTFVFRGLMFEAEAENFRRAGIQIGSVSTSAEDSLLRESMGITVTVYLSPNCARCAVRLGRATGA